MLGFCPLLCIFFACSKTSNTPDRVSARDTTAVTTTVPDTIPASISILYGDSLYGSRGYQMPWDLAFVVKNKEGNILNGVPVSLSPAANCGFATSVTAVTNPAGYADFFWTLGMNPDSVQTLKVEVQNDTSVSVTFHAIALDIKRYHFVGTLRIVDTAANDTYDYFGPPDFPALSENTDMPFIVDSLSNIISRLNSPMVLTINGYTLTGSGSGNNGNAWDVNQVLEGLASVYKTYPNAGSGQIYSYGQDWTFTGTLVNNVYSGTFSLRISIATKSSTQDIYNYYVLKFGTFTTTTQ